MKNYDQISSQIYTCHDSSAVMACANLWPDWIVEIEIRAKTIFTRFQLWADKCFVKWVPGAFKLVPNTNLQSLPQLLVFMKENLYSDSLLPL